MKGVNFTQIRVYSSFKTGCKRHLESGVFVICCVDSALELRFAARRMGMLGFCPPLIQLALPPIDCPLVNLPNFCLTTRSRGIRMRGIVCEAGFADASHAGPAHDRVLAGKMSYKGDIVCLQ